MLAKQYNRSYDLKTIITRAFNHEGLRRGDVFVTSAFAKQLVEIERNKRSVLLVGNLDAIRDFTDVRDVVKAYWLLANKGHYGEVYNICSGVGITMKELLDKFISISDAQNYVIRVDETKLRPSDVPVLVGNCDRLKALGWEREISLDQMIKDILEYWRNK